MKARDPFYDNLKFILMVFVVFGHFTFEYRDKPLMISICNAIYTFHMPLFIFVSGYFSRNIKTQRKEDILYLLIPYFIMEIINLMFTKVTHLGFGNKDFLIPTYHNWYLLSLFIWRLLVPYFNFLNKPIGIALAFGISITAGWIAQLNDFLALYRTLYFLPVFLLGYHSENILLTIEKYARMKWMAIGMFFILTIGIFLISYLDFNKAGNILYAFAPLYGYMGSFSNMVLRNFALLSGLICSFLFLFMIPRKETFYTRFGANTLYVYLFHMFIVWPIIKLSGTYKQGITELISLAIAVPLTYLLSQEFVKRILQPIIDPLKMISLIRGKKQ